MEHNKMILAIVRGEDHYDTVHALNEKGFYVTVLSTSGGFLRQKNTTLMICTDEARVEEALAISNKDVVDALGGLPAHKLHCSVLAEEAIKSAVKDYYDRNGIAYDHSQFPDCENCESCRMV